VDLLKPLVSMALVAKKVAAVLVLVWKELSLPLVCQES
jgi:hypothetical protein